MKTLILGANDGFWCAPDRAYERDIISGIEAWVFAMDGDHCNTLDATSELINRYDLIIGNTNGGEYRPKLLELQKSRKKGVRWVSMIEGCATEYLAPDSTLKKIFDGSDLVNVINRHALEFFRSCTTTRCEYIGIPYPAATIRSQFQPLERQDVWTPSNLYNAKSSFSSVLAALPVTIRIGKQCHGFFRKPIVTPQRKSLFSSFRPKEKAVEQPRSELLNSVVFHGEMGMGDYFKILSETAYAFVNLDHRYTWARDVLDCAALQIPCIATRATGHAENYFPALTIPDEFSIAEARALLERLYADKEFYEQCAKVPIELLESLSHSNMKEKLLATLR